MMGWLIFSVIVLAMFIGAFAICVSVITEDDDE